MSESAWGGGKTRPGADPWATNYFDPPTPHVEAPGPQRRTPRLVPEQHELFTVQRHALDVLHDIEALLHALGKHAHDPHVEKALRALERDAENTYRVIRTWLKDNVNQGLG